MKYQPEGKQSKNLKLQKMAIQRIEGILCEKRGYIMSLVSKVYCDSSEHIRNEARLRGIKRD